MKRTTVLFATILLSAAFFFVAPPTSNAQETPAAKTARLLNESKVKFTKVDEGVWTIPFEGKQLKNFNVIVAADKNYVLMFVVLSNQKQFRPEPALLKKLLAHNDEFDRVKIGIDKDGYVAVRIDLTMRLIDRQEFTDSLDQTAAAADQVHASIAPFLISAK